MVACLNPGMLGKARRISLRDKEEALSGTRSKREMEKLEGQ